MFPYSPFPLSLSHPQHLPSFPSPGGDAVFLSHQLGQWSQLSQGTARAACSADCYFFKWLRNEVTIAFSSVKALIFLYPATPFHENSQALLPHCLTELKRTSEFQSYQEGWMDRAYVHRNIISLENQPKNNPMSEAFKTSSKWIKTRVSHRCTDESTLQIQWVSFSPKIHITKVTRLCKAHLSFSESSEVAVRMVSEEAFRFLWVSHLKIH